MVMVAFFFAMGSKMSVLRLGTRWNTKMETTRVDADHQTADCRVDDSDALANFLRSLVSGNTLRWKMKAMGTEMISLTM